VIDLSTAPEVRIALSNLIMVRYEATITANKMI
jgi:hypothetical protein